MQIHTTLTKFVGGHDKKYGYFWSCENRAARLAYESDVPSPAPPAFSVLSSSSLLLLLSLSFFISVVVDFGPGIKMSGSSNKSALFLFTTEGGIPLPLGVAAVPVDAGNEGAVGRTGGSALGSTDAGLVGT